MKLTISHRHHAPSRSIVKTLESELAALQPDLPIEKARVHLERDPEGDPPFSVSFHLATPGPDIVVKASGHTLRAAVHKALDRISARIGKRPPSREPRD